MLPAADCLAKVFAAASEGSGLSQAQQSVLCPVGAIAHGQRQPSAIARLLLDVRPVSPGSVQLIRRSASPCRSREVIPRRSLGSDRHKPLLQLCMSDNAFSTTLVDFAQGAPLSQSRRFVLDNARTELDDTRRFKSGETLLSLSRYSGSLGGRAGRPFRLPFASCAHMKFGAGELQRSRRVRKVAKKN